MSDVYLDTEGVAEHFKVPVHTVRKWRAQGTGPRGVKIGRHVRYRLSDCETWADAHADQRVSALG